MGLVRAEINLINGFDYGLNLRGKLSSSEIRQIKSVMLVDSGATMMAVNETVKAQLGLLVVDHRKAQLADGSVQEFEVVGPIEVRFANRKATCNAMVLSGDTKMLLGAIPLEEMDLVIPPGSNTLMVNPDHPIMAQLPLK